MKRFRPFEPLTFLLIGLILGTILLAGCGGGGGGGAGAPAPSPVEGPTWDEMGWDKGKWG